VCEKSPSKFLLLCEFDTKTLLNLSLGVDLGRFVRSPICLSVLVPSRLSSFTESLWLAVAFGLSMSLFCVLVVLSWWCLRYWLRDFCGCCRRDVLYCNFCSVMVGCCWKSLFIAVGCV
jgi:hypothetical protein